MKKCPSCNNDISEEAKFCPYCGKPVPENAGERFCPNCGSRIEGDPSFCPSCGENLRAAKGSKEEETVLNAVGALEDEVDSALGSSAKKGRSSFVSERNFVVWILISIFTCGIGALVWLGFLVNPGSESVRKEIRNADRGDTIKVRLGSNTCISRSTINFADFRRTRKRIHNGVASSASAHHQYFMLHNPNQ